MEYDTFSKLVDNYKHKQPILFALEQDKTFSLEKIESFENRLYVEFPKKYKQFLSDYGGGYFGYANIYSLDEESNFYLLNYNDTPIDRYLRISDNGCGDYYSLFVDNKKCSDQVYFYEHDTATICNTEYADILEYLVKVGLKKENGESHEFD